MKLGKIICMSTLAVTTLADRFDTGNEAQNTNKVRCSVHSWSYNRNIQKNKQEKQKDKKARLLRTLRKEAPVKLEDGVVVWNEGIGDFRLVGNFWLVDNFR